MAIAKFKEDEMRHMSPLNRTRSVRESGKRAFKHGSHAVITAGTIAAVAGNHARQRSLDVMDRSFDGIDVKGGSIKLNETLNGTLKAVTAVADNVSEVMSDSLSKSPDVSNVLATISSKTLQVGINTTQLDSSIARQLDRPSTAR